MPDAAWKAWERRVAALFGGKRRGPDVGGNGGGRSDVVAPGWSIEVKLLARPGYADLLGAARQAEQAAAPAELPIAVVKRKRAEDADALAVMRLETFLEWFVSPAPEVPTLAEVGPGRAGEAAGSDRAPAASTT